MILGFEKEDSVWKISSPNNEMNENIAIILNDEDILPDEKKLWKLPESSCNKGLDEDRFLLLANCKVGQFSCDNGECLDKVRRCDRVAQCSDMSDEKTCKPGNIDPTR